MKPKDKTPKKDGIHVMPTKPRNIDWRKASRTPKERAAVRAAKVAAALERLGVTAEQLAEAPEITPILRLADGGMKQVLSAMRAGRDDADINQFLKVYDGLSYDDRMVLPMEAVCIAAGLNSSQLLGACIFALQSHAASIIRVLSITSHPKIMKARIRFGQLPGGERDRTALDTVLGLLPSPKNQTTFIGKAVFGSGRSVMDQQRELGDGEEEQPEQLAELAENIDLDRLFPPANAMQEKLIAIRERAALPAPNDPSKPPRRIN